MKFFFIFLIVPYLIGVYISSNNLGTMNEIFQPLLDVIVPKVHEQLTKSSDRKLAKESASQNEESVSGAECYNRFLTALQRGGDGINDEKNPFEGVTLVLHRNGEAQACGETADMPSAFETVLENSLDNRCPNFENKYQFESLLTRVLHTATQTACASPEEDRSQAEGFYGFCDLGESRTPVLADHNLLVPILNGSNSYLPCHYHDIHGVRVSSLSQLARLSRFAGNADENDTTTTNNNNNNNNHNNGTTDCVIGVDGETDPNCIANNHHRREFHLYAVQAGRMFIFGPAYPGQIIPLPHVTGGEPDKPVYMRVISTEPKVFDIINFFSKEESDFLVHHALEETKDSHRIKRSSTGPTGYNVNKRRTSESGYDTDSLVSKKVKRRCFDVLGFDEYKESYADGLQILRYNLTTAYIPHMDWIDGNDQLEHDYESGGKGGNRYATILLYFSDLEEGDGGETVFTESWPPDVAVEDRIDHKDALMSLRQTEQGKLLKEGSWEENMVAKCRSRLAVRPQSARAVLFYSQLPNGKPDPKSLHGGCPVLRGTKWAANLWVWNTPRDGYVGNPKNPKFKGTKAEEKVEEHPGKVSGTFRNSGENPEFADAKLYYEDQFWAPLGHGDVAVHVNTYPTHVWNIKVNDETKKTFVIESSEPKTQIFTI